MNVARSINVALAKKDMSRTALAKALNVTNNNVHNIIRRNAVKSETLKRLADVFEMPVSEFIKLGED